MNNKYNLRAIAASAISQVLDKGQSLSTALPEYQKNISDKDKSLLQELCFGTLRVLPELEWYVQQLMAKVMTGKQRPLHYLLMVGLYQLLYTRIPAHAAVAETVNGAIVLKRPQMKGLINGVMRQFQRQQQIMTEQFQSQNGRFLHPGWLLQRIQLAYPQQWEAIVDANNQKPPMWLRVNRQHHSREQYLQLLQLAGIEAFPHPDYPDALRLAVPCSVTLLPGFEQGWVTVQDASAQGCVSLLEPQNGEVILDLCAAPGGKTTHILEAAPEAKVIAVDVDENRLKRVTENLIRLNQQATVIIGDGREPQAWSNGQIYDRILLDAPCSATGVIRRHPDIKWLRRNSDIDELVTLQKEIINAIWPQLKSGGTMIYATCSILPEENRLQIDDFIQNHTDAKLVDIGDTQSSYRQNLPSSDGGDGFFYAKLIKA
ncbi:16S rRNA (cytosine(967)-C(5))-methyltransferase RsmB [Jinshanibacter sp. LJY008]|uniref:Ribosomal RNA small subunit methyltransferase B n=1 Tax=Limnobaculum eriocheiris TaxID=2897391 RepID=A0A9X1SQY9_9GAMM|nr:16S rRNA (cytosine(967)-C(5))-methyltransferase RsmB [Limnobaculum eriocheiris]MCD1127282.1 16S rRNA (cytosine(967)-C(5))-methyltransferase RsmB [Limnobaculum eriocheiris]